jgi:hypothetical protein
MAECCCGSNVPVINHFVKTDYGVAKGKTGITPELIAKTAFALTEKIADE